jgi:hypothetical protein
MYINHIYEVYLSPLDCHIKDVSIIQNSIIQIVMIIMKQASDSSNFV